MRQVALLESFCAANGWSHEVISGAGSGLDYHERGPRILIEDFTKNNNAASRARGKLHARTGSPREVRPGSPKAGRIAGNNLGREEPWVEGAHALRPGRRTLSDQAVKEVAYGAVDGTRAKCRAPQVAFRRPRALVVEDLSHLGAKSKSKKLLRICSTRMRSENQVP